MSDKIGRAVLEIVTDSDKFFTDIKRAKGAASGLKTSFDKAGRSLKNFGRQATAVGRDLTLTLTAPIVGLGTAAVAAFASFDQAMTESLSIMGKQGQELRAEMEETAKAVALNVTASSDEAAKAYFYLASAGLDAAQSIKALPAVAEFAMAGAFDMARATDLLTDAQSALGRTSADTNENLENMTEISDVLVRANTLANASVEQFSEALTNKAGAALRLLNKDVEEGVAVLAAFADQGVKGTEAGERLNIVLRDMQNANLKAREEWDQLGISVYDSDGKMRNIADIIGGLTGALSGMSDEQVRTTLTQLKFQDRSVAAIMTLLGLEDKIRGYEGALRDAGGATKDVADLQRTSFTFAMKRVKEQTKQAAIALGGALAPTLLELAKVLPPIIAKVTEAAKWFASLPAPIRTGAVVIALLVAAIGPLLLAVGLAASAVGGLVTAAGAIMPVLAVAGAAIAAIGAPVALVVAALVALGIAAWTFRDEIGAAIGATVAYIVECFDAMVAAVRPWLEPVLGLLGSLMEMFTALGELIAAVAVVIIGKAMEIGQGILTWLWDALEPVRTFLQPWIEMFSAAFGLAATSIVGFAKSIFTGVYEWLFTKFTAVVDGIREHIDSITGFFRDLKQKVVGGSIIPDMMAQIKQETAKFSAVMVQPAVAATGSTGAAFGKMGAGIRTEFENTTLATEETGAAMSAAMSVMSETTGAVLRALAEKLKKSAIGTALISAYEAMAKTLASLPFPLNIAAGAAALAAGMWVVNKIKSLPIGFAAGTPGLDFASFGAATAVNLHGHEAVVPRGGGHLLAGEIAAAMPRGDDRSLEELQAIRESLDDLPYTITRSWKNAMASA